MQMHGCGSCKDALGQSLAKTAESESGLSEDIAQS